MTALDAATEANQSFESLPRRAGAQKLFGRRLTWNHPLRAVALARTQCVNRHPGRIFHCA